MITAVAGLVIGAAGAASAATSYVGGGTWWHGLTPATVYSDYHHPTRCHGSTAVGNATVRASAPAGRVSRATATRAPSNNSSYWRHC